MRPAHFFSLLLLIATPLSAAWVTFSPVAPTSQTPISVTFITEPLGDCGPTQGDVTVAGNSVHVHLFAPPGTPPCPPDVRPRVIAIQLGTLPIGAYTLTADYGTIHWASSFVVRNPSAPLAVTSTAGLLPFGFLPVVPSAVRFGGVAGSLVTIDDRTFALAPPHASGLFDIEITDANGNVTTLPQAIDYFDPAQPPDPTIFERVLFPMLDSAAGVNGSRWETLGDLENLDALYVETFNTVGTVPQLRPPFSSFQFLGRGYPHGAVLYVPRQSMMAFSSRIAEVSEGSDPGVEIAPVRESQLFRSTMTLVNIPNGAGYRTRVRIYALDPLPDPRVQVSITSTHSWATSLTMQRSASIDQPYYAELDLSSVPELQDHSAVTLQINVSGPAWAIASAVHNASQRAVVITPQ